MEQTPQRAPRDTSPAKRPQYPARRPGNRAFASVTPSTRASQATHMAGAVLVCLLCNLQAAHAETHSQFAFPADPAIGFSLVFGVVGLVCSLIGFVAGFACCALITAIYWLLA